MATTSETPASTGTAEHTTVRSSLGDLAVHAAGRPFQQRVGELLDQIPYGTTVTYGELARELGGGVTAQETGAAVGRNPVSILGRPARLF